MGRPTDQETAALEKTASYSWLPRQGGVPHHAEPCREASGLVSRHSEPGENMGKSLHCDLQVEEWFSQEGKLV